MNQKIYIVITAVIVVLLVFVGVWFLFFRSTPSTTTPVDTSFGTSANNSTAVTSNNTSSSNNTQPVASSGQISAQKIFEIAAGPIAGATLIQTLHPTTTLARYINQTDGHVYDLPLDTPGAVARAVSNVTIPGASRVVWLEQGNAALLQYIDGTSVKSVYLGLPQATTSTKVTPTRIQFLPDNIIDLAASPDGKSLVYMLKTSNGSDGYVANSDGTGAKKIFSLPLSQVLVSWPSQDTLMVGSKSAAGVPGIVFSIDVKSGIVTPLLYANALTATADKTFTHVIYQSIDDNASKALTYSHNINTGLNTKLAFNPYPEKCVMSSLTALATYCTSPLQPPTTNYLDLWHQGAASSADTIYSINIETGLGEIVAIAGSIDGGVPSDILEMALSPNERYLSFTTKGARALWGVRLTQR